MLNIFLQCDIILNEINKFSDEVLYLGPLIDDNRLDIFEQKIRYAIPIDFKYILKKHNGISLNGTEIYGLDKKLRGSSLDEIYNFEHMASGYTMPREFLPFSPDGRGNHYCLNLSKLIKGLCPVVFWQHDIFYENLNQIEECNLNFMDWVKEVMIGWTLNDINYDGSDKQLFY